MDQRRALELARRGAEEGFGWLFQRYRLPVYRFLRRARLDRDAAHDVLQETFIRAFRAIGSLRAEERFEPWLLRIARRETLRAIGRGRGHEPLESEIDAVCEAEELAAIAREEERLLEAIRELAPTIEPPEIREVAMRYYLGEKQTAESIALELGLRAGTVRKRLFTFREKLRKKLIAAGVFEE